MNTWIEPLAVATKPLPAVPNPGPVSPPARRWACALAVLAVCGASFGVQRSLDRRHALDPESALKAPFPLDRLPTRLGGWEACDGSIVIDPRTLLISGCTSHVARQYVNRDTGVKLSVMVAFGPADRVVGHTPSVCFPALGYASSGRPIALAVETQRGAPPARFEAAVYEQQGPGGAGRVEVIHGFRHDGLWTADGTARRKQFLRRPSMLKVQLQRRVAPGERGGPGGPGEDFLKSLVIAIEEEARAGRAPAAVENAAG